MSDAPLLLTGSGRLLLPEPYDGPMPWAISAREGRIAWVGARSDAPPGEAVDLGSALVTPGLVDAHTHPAFLGDRSGEAAARLAGAPYTGGGILRTVTATRAGSDAELRDAITDRLQASLAGGTTTIECKSGYGLSTAEELRALRLIGEAAAQLPIRVVRTFLGAHAVPPEAGSMDEYASTVADEMLPAIAAAGVAEFCDVFCDRGFFSEAATERILRSAAALGLGIRMHADQLTRSGGAELAVRLGAVSADHLEQLDAAGVAALAASSTVATLLPGPAVVMRGGLPPARALLDAGVTVALASDANAGTFGAWGAMPLVIGLGATLLGMTVGEAVTAATSGGAAALGLTGRRGVIRVGADADLVAWDAEHEGAFALNLGTVRPSRTWIGGVQTWAENDVASSASQIAR
jgi:imidazolonepropionase